MQIKFLKFTEGKLQGALHFFEVERKKTTTVHRRFSLFVEGLERSSRIERKARAAGMSSEATKEYRAPFVQQNYNRVQALWYKQKRGSQLECTVV